MTQDLVSKYRNKSPPKGEREKKKREKMAEFVPPIGTQWVFVGLWLANLVYNVFWMAYKRTRTELDSYAGTYHMWIIWGTLILFIPVSESIYIFSPDSDPWNSAPYFQWACWQLRSIALIAVFLGFTSNMFRRIDPLRYTSRIGSCATAAISLLSILFVVVYKPAFNNGTGTMPMQLIPVLMDWIYVAVALFVAITCAAMSWRVQNASDKRKIEKWRSMADIDGTPIPGRVSQGYGGSGSDSGSDSDAPNRRGDDSRGVNKAYVRAGSDIMTMLLITWITLLVGYTIYAIMIIVRKDQYWFSGSTIYYFMTKYWVTELAPYSSLFLYAFLIMVLGTVIVTDRAIKRLNLPDASRLYAAVRV